MAKNSKSGMAIKAGIIGGGAVIGASGVALGANAVYNNLKSDDVNPDELEKQGQEELEDEPEVVIDEEMETDEDVDVEYGEPVEANVVLGVHHGHQADPIVEAEEVDDVALVIDPETEAADVAVVEPEIEVDEILPVVATVDEENTNVDEIVDEIIVDDPSTDISYNVTNEDTAFGADADYASDILS